MSELINNSEYRRERLKELILKLHEGESADRVKQQLTETLKSIPYGEVVEVEQELIQEGLPESEVLKLCDVHGEVLEGNVDLSAAREIPEGHPVDVFKKENAEIDKVAGEASGLLEKLKEIDDETFNDYVNQLKGHFNGLMDVDKHYQRKEHLVFPYLEKNAITGPPKVMWGKHDEIREQLKGCIELLNEPELTKQDLEDSLDILFFRL